MKMNKVTEMLDSLIEKVVVVEPYTNRYDGYDAFFKENNIEHYHTNYVKGKKVRLVANKKYSLIFTGKHYIRNYPLFLIMDENKNMFLVDKHALKK